ncbi:NAD(P)H-dependent oxidoreductase [Paracoccus sp. M683]|uniref:NAD(P)H-dependent oxidoreductase n=1 Tax=Paracoccus sp. M683 TaxID=2594268 RepID=UPI002619E63F|nr:NAD(P)H-dependent oxidoreductase [Paracoccus sp. M683]
MSPDLPNLSPEALMPLDIPAVPRATHPPRILLLCGSLRERSCSRFATFEAERLLRHFGRETRVFHANGLPLPEDIMAGLFLDEAESALALEDHEDLRATYADKPRVRLRRTEVIEARGRQMQDQKAQPQERVAAAIDLLLNMDRM